MPALRLFRFRRSARPRRTLKERAHALSATAAQILRGPRRWSSKRGADPARRAFVTSSAAAVPLAVVAGTAALSAPTALMTAAEPDAELLALLREYDDFFRRYGLAAEEEDRLSTLYQDYCARTKPDVLRWRRSDRCASIIRRGEWYSPAEVDRFRDDQGLDLAYHSGHDEAIRRAKEIVAAHDQWDEACERYSQTIGFPAARQLADQAHDEMTRLACLIRDRPATSLRGLARSAGAGRARGK